MKNIYKVIILHVTLSVYVTGQIISNNATSNDERERPCPDAADIEPCICIVNPDSSMTMDCSEITSEHQLSEVFSMQFPFPNFYMLTIYDNQYLQTLNTGVFGEATFKLFRIENCLLEVVETGALSGSYETAVDINFSHNKIMYFPFNDTPEFSVLAVLNLGDNSISNFEPIYSQTLNTLDLSKNPLGTLPAIAFTGVPALQDLHLNHAQMKDIPPGIFSGLPVLSFLDLEYNQLSQLETDAVRLTTLIGCTVDLYENDISSVDVEAISGLNSGSLILSKNKITTLHEEVYRPLLQDSVDIDFDENPLECGCEVAWIVLDNSFMDLISENTTCSDGEYFHDLDPAIFEQC